MQKISNEEAHQIIEERKPLGQFYTIEDGKYIGIDNSDGNAWVEEFDTFGKCATWMYTDMHVD